MNFKLFIALLLIFLLSIPCVFGADNWNTFGYDFNRTSYSPETINITNWGQIWNFTGFDFSDDNIIVADGHVVFGSESPDAFLVLNATTGTEICRVNTTSDALDCSHENGIVYGALGTGNVTAFYINNCTQIWNFSTGGNIYRSNTLIVGDFIYIGNDKNYTYAINKTDGTEIWSFDVPGANFRTRPVYYNDTVYIGDSLSPYKMYAINATDGSELWNVTVGTSLLYGGAVLYPSGDDAYIAWGSYDNHIYVLNSSDGAEVCNYSVPYGDVYLAAPAYHSDTLYFGSSSNMYAINATNCSLIWRTGWFDWFYQTPSIADDVLFVANFNGHVYAFNATTGGKLWDTTISGDTYGNGAIYDGKYYLGTDNKIVYAFGQPTINQASVVELISPDNGYTSTSDTLSFTANYSDPEGSAGDCELFINGTGYGTNTSVPNGTEFIIQNNATLDNGFYQWWVNCTDGTTTIKSDVRTLTIEVIECIDSDADGFYAIAEGCCTEGVDCDCDDSNASIFPPPTTITTINSDVTFCSGTYQRNDTNIIYPSEAVTITCNGTIIVGNFTENQNYIHFAEMGAGSTITGCTFVNMTLAILMNDENLTIDNCTFNASSVDGNKVGFHYTNNVFNNLTGFIFDDNAVFDGNYFYNAEDAIPLSTTNLNNVTITNNYFAPTMTGLFSTNNTNNTRIENNIMDGAGDSFFLIVTGTSPSYNISFINNTVTDSSTTYFQFQYTDNLTFSNNTIHNSTFSYMLFNDVNNSNIENNDLYNLSQTGFNITNSYSNNITGNTLLNITNDGIALTSSHSNNITGNNITDVGMTDTTYSYLTDMHAMNLSGTIYNFSFAGTNETAIIYDASWNYDDINANGFTLDETNFDPTHDFGVAVADLDCVGGNTQATVWFDYDAFGWDDCDEWSDNPVIGTCNCYGLSGKVLLSNGAGNNFTFNASAFNSTFNISDGYIYPPRVDTVDSSFTRYYGLKISSSNNNLIYNNFFNNTNNAYDNGTNYWNTTKTEQTNILGNPYIGGNYWDDYTGIDADGDYIGDTSHTGTTFTDYLPLVLYFNMPVVQEIITLRVNTSSSNFGVDEEITVRTNVSDQNGIIDVRSVTLSLSSPSGETVINNASMISTVLIDENTSTFEYNFTLMNILGLDYEIGNYTIKIYATDSMDYVGYNSKIVTIGLGSTLQIHLTLINTTSEPYSLTDSINIIKRSTNTILSLIPYSGTLLEMLLGQQSNQYILSINQSLTHSNILLAFTQGDSETINNKIPMINDQTFLMKISPSFAYGLGTYYPIKIALNYKGTMNITGNNLKFYEGNHNMSAENMGIIDDLLSILISA